MKRLWVAIVIAGVLYFIAGLINNPGINEITTPYKYYGYYPHKQMFVNNDGLRYQLRKNGLVRVLGQDNIETSRYTMAISGKIRNRLKIIKELDYDWTWTNQTVMKNITLYDDAQNPLEYVYKEYIFTGYNNNKRLNWTKVYEFDPIHKAKITDVVTNEFGNFTQTRLWYVFEANRNVSFGGNEYDLKNRELSLKGNFNHIPPRIISGESTLDYQDLLDNGFILSNIKIGNGTVIGNKNRRIFALGFKKGNGRFNKGQKITLDPTSTGFMSCNLQGKPLDQWTDSGAMCADDANRTHSSTIGDITYANDFQFGMADSANVTGIEIMIQARGGSGFCLTKAYAQIRAKISLNNGTDISPNSQAMSFACSTIGSDTSLQRGSSTDKWGYTRDISGAELKNSTSGIEMNHSLNSGGNFASPEGIDLVQMQVYYDSPTIFFQNRFPQPSGNNILNSSYWVNFTTDQLLDYAIISTNQSGAWVNFTIPQNYMFLGDYGYSLRMGGRQKGANNGSNFDFTIYYGKGTSDQIWDVPNLTIEDNDPTVLINSPNNINVTTNKTEFSVNVSDPDLDIVGVEYRVGNSYFYWIDNLTSGDTFIYNASVIGLNYSDNDLYAYWKMDNYWLENENWTAVNTEFTMKDYGLGFMDGHYGDTKSTSNNVQPCSENNLTTPYGVDCFEWVDGTDDRIKVEEGTDNLTYDVFADKHISIGAWFYHNNSDTQVILGKGDMNFDPNRFVKFYSAGMLLGDGNGNTCFSNTGLSTLNQWEHIVWTWNGTTALMYANGVQSDSDACSLTINQTKWSDSNYDTFIGGGGISGGTQEWDGMIDELFIYNKTLTPTEVTNIYNISANNINWTATVYDASDDFSSNTAKFNILPVSDSCTYSSGNWLINFADNCVISSNVVGDALADMIFSGSGSFKINSGVIVSGFNYLFAPDTGVITTYGTGGLRLG